MLTRFCFDNVSICVNMLSTVVFINQQVSAALTTLPVPHCTARWIEPEISIYFFLYQETWRQKSSQVLKSKEITWKNILSYDWSLSNSKMADVLGEGVAPPFTREADDTLWFFRGLGQWLSDSPLFLTVESHHLFVCDKFFVNNSLKITYRRDFVTSHINNPHFMTRNSIPSDQLCFGTILT